MADDEKPVRQPVALSASDLTFWQRHRLTLLLAITLAIAIILTCVSVTIYNISGAAQLDFSRPGLRDVSSKVDKNEKIDTYSGSGPINKDTINEFITLYDKQADKAKKVDAFNGDPLNPEVLEFGSSSNPED